MAIILTRGATRTAAATPSFPLRSTTVEVAQTGLITKMIGPSNQTVSTINLGYQGDDGVTYLRIKPWISAETLEANYIASLVFYNEKTTVTNSYDLQREGSEFFLPIPKAITEPGGNYQIFLAFKERLEGGSSGSGAVGTEDDPAYREVFISHAFKGAVNTSSGYQFVKDFDWTAHIYDYEKGVIQVGDRLWTDKGSNSYETTIILGGIQSGTDEDDIVVHSVDGITITNKELIDAKTLKITIEIEGDSTLSQLDDIIIEYPVNFSAQLDSSKVFAQKPSIDIKYDASVLQVTSENKSLGMKLDAYVTPINLTNLQELRGETSKYTIFSKDSRTYVCPALNNICWIPVGITNTPGVWNVSFICKDNQNVYYTDVLKLSVIDNVLTKESLNSDTVYSVMQSVDGTNLYDVNEQALYLIDDGSGSGKLNHTKDTINRAIGWVAGVYDSVSADDLSAIVVNVPTIKTTLETTVGNVDQLTTKVDTLETENAQRILDIAALDEKITASDTAALEARISTAEGSITRIDTELTSTKTQTATNKDDIVKLKAEDVQIKNDAVALGGRVSTNETNIVAINKEISDLKYADTQLNTRIGVNAASCDSLRSDIDYITNHSIPLINQALADNANAHSNYTQLLNAEVARASREETRIEGLLEDEIARAKGIESNLDVKIVNETTRATEAEKILEGRVSTNKDNITTLQNGLKTETQARSEADVAIQKNLDILNASSTEHTTAIANLQTNVSNIQNSKNYIKNDYADGIIKPIVSKIILIQSKTIEELATMVDVPYETAEELNAFKQELLEKGIITLEDDLNNIPAESVYDTLKLKNKTETNTLYLLSEEE